MEKLVIFLTISFYHHYNYFDKEKYSYNRGWVYIRKNEKLVKIGVTKVVSVVSVVSQSEIRTAQFCVEATEHFLFHYLFISKLYSLKIHVFYREYTKKWKIGQNRGHKSGQRCFSGQPIRKQDSPVLRWSNRTLFKKKVLISTRRTAR